jgi:hypothetical protein
MTDKTNIEIGVPEFEVIVRQKDVPYEIYPFDLIIHVTKDGAMLHLSDDMQQVLNSYLKDYPDVYIKTNWFSNDVHVFKGDLAKETAQEEARANAPRTKPEPRRRTKK